MGHLLRTWRSVVLEVGALDGVEDGLGVALAEGGAVVAEGEVRICSAGGHAVDHEDRVSSSGCS